MRLWSVVAFVGAVVACSRSDQRTPALDEPRAHEVEVSAATFLMGCNPARDDACSLESEPSGTVAVARFFLDRTEVSQGAYAACVAAGACTPPPPSCAGTWTATPREDALPMTCVDHADAARFCAWRGGRLPSEAEWERAARGVDGRTYPWGDDKPDCVRAAIASCGTVPMPVGARAAGASPVGALDMGGNVSEWTSTPTGDDPRYLVVKDYGLDWWHMRSSMRLPVQLGYRESGLGFRCARSPRG
ncbi:MAG: SUMF1/EgtB/PvdO family nonheme iron enzyme [Deltaproteobacteria bacterium]|nr:SUMF1/EgtB/PvdO family nonheme iron enzyme [Deltaproteobacteria bacterium]